MHKNDNCVRASVCVYKKSQNRRGNNKQLEKNWQNVEKGYEGMG